ncbi:hypothetical protein [Burkholderia pyrrocinia]|uniref:hypothetical protein n=1 Tax=Burkholderia pyrrocinia TaxID=60550 RepID=UPI002AB23808|nr:hypothetical protein [Burkholderia pyrrocinia]
MKLRGVQQCAETREQPGQRHGRSTHIKIFLPALDEEAGVSVNEFATRITPTHT